LFSAGNIITNRTVARSTERICPLLFDSAVATTEIRLCVARRMHQGHEDFLVPQPCFPPVVFNDRAAAAQAMLGLESAPDPFGGVPMLLGPSPILGRDLVDDSQLRTQLRRSTDFFR